MNLKWAESTYDGVDFVVV